MIVYLNVVQYFQDVVDNLVCPDVWKVVLECEKQNLKAFDDHKEVVGQNGQFEVVHKFVEVEEDQLLDLLGHFLEEPLLIEVPVTAHY